MRVFLKVVYLFVFFILVGSCSLSFAAITFDLNGKWETTFDCADQIQTDAGWITCDDMQAAGGWSFSQHILTDGSTNNWIESSTPNEWYYNANTFDTFNLAMTRDLFVGIVDGKKYDILKPGPPWGVLNQPGELVAETWAVGNNDSLDFKTAYIYSTTDPDLETNGQIRVIWSHVVPIPGGYVSSITVDANNPNGVGGKGFRNLDGDGSNQDTGPGRVFFTEAQKELWIRYYIRHELGYDWSPRNSYTPPRIQPLGQKHIYLRTGDGAGSHYAGFAYNKYAIVTQDTYDYTQMHGPENSGWPSIMGVSDITKRHGSDGQWHCYEIYVKMDTDLGNGAGKIWVDGKLIVSNPSVCWSGAVNGYQTLAEITSARRGWTYFDFAENQTAPDNRGAIMAVDYDDIVVYNKTPPNKDVHGNSFIGPIVQPPR